MGTVTLTVGAVTIVGTTICIGASDGLATIECLQGAKTGYAVTLAGAFATYETTQN